MIHSKDYQMPAPHVTGVYSNNSTGWEDVYQVQRRSVGFQGKMLGAAADPVLAYEALLA